MPDPVAARREYLGGAGGLYTWTFFHMFGTDVKIMVDIHKLHAGVFQLFGVDVQTSLHPPTNTRTTKLANRPEDMYDDNMVDSVYDEDGVVISLLGYEEPFSSLKDAVVNV